MNFMCHTSSKDTCIQNLDKLLRRQGFDSKKKKSISAHLEYCKNVFVIPNSSGKKQVAT